MARRALALALMLGLGLTVAAQSRPTPNPHSRGRLFPPQDLGLLEAPDRDEWQRPHQILDALGIAEASVVADVGAGSGWFTVRLARRVGPNGKVCAQDVQQEMLTATTRRVRSEELANVEPVLGRGSDPGLAPGLLDAALAVDVLHEIDDRVTFLRNLGQALKPGGRIGIVDFKPGGAGPGPDANERVPADEVEADAARAGLTLLRRETFLPFQYFLIFGRSDASTVRAVSGRVHCAAAVRPPRPPAP